MLSAYIKFNSQGSLTTSNCSLKIVCTVLRHVINREWMMDSGSGLCGHGTWTVSAQERAEDEVEEAQAGGGSLFFLGHVTNGSLIINSHCASAL